VDTHKQTKFIATGSAAAALRLKSRESGAGRFTDFVLPPLTFYEFLDLQGLIDTQFSFDESGMPHPNDIESLNSHFIDYINYGGYPEALFSEAIRNNPERYIRSDIIEKVLLRDLPSLYGIQDIRELSRLFYTLAYQTGMEVTYSDLSSSAEVAANTVKKYIEFLESAFLIRTVNRIDNSAKTFQKINFFKVYLTNPSIYTALFGLVDKGQNIGNLVETALYCQAMHSRLFQNLHYARWKKGPHAGEVDFVCLNNNFKVSICLESKWSDNKIDLKGFRYFCTKNKSTYCFVATKSRFGYKEDESGMNISFFPAAWLAFHIGLMEFDDKQEDLASALESIRNERPDQMALFAQDT
jgi:hypothetical protein